MTHLHPCLGLPKPPKPTFDSFGSSKIQYIYHSILASFIQVLKQVADKIPGKLFGLAEQPIISTTRNYPYNTYAR